MPCASDNDLAAFADGLLPPGDASAVASHVDECGSCRAAVADVARSRSSFAVPVPPDRDEVPEPIASEDRPDQREFGGSRYRLLRLLGAGGMGIVYEAWDEHLGRNIALKLMLSENASAERRIRREARSMARVSHPNVVAIFDVGVCRGRTFIITERVTGGSLRIWAAARARPVREVVAKLIEASRGLEAAHAQGVLHLDVTPGNILVDARGRTKVCDFGLARLMHASTEHRGGTLAYAPPEIARDGAPEAASDQFGLCATARAVLCLHSTWGSVPRAVRRVIETGSRDDPKARYESMGALRDALEQTQRGRRWIAVAVTATAGVGIAVLGFRPSTTTECPELELAPATTGVYAIDEAGRGRVDQWRDSWRASCSDDTPHAPRMRACLRTQRTALLELDRIDPKTLKDNATDVLAFIETDLDPSACPGPIGEMLAFENGETQRLREDLATARVLAFMDAPPTQVERLSALLLRARTVGDEVLIAQALQARGTALIGAGRFDDAAQDFEQAAPMAYRLRADATAVRAWLGLMEVHGVGRTDLAAAEALLPFVDAGLDRLAHPVELEAMRDRTLGSIYAYAGDAARAGPLLSRVADRMKSAHGPRSMAYGIAREMWAIQATYAQNFGQARDALVEARKIYEDHVGPAAQVVARAVANLAAMEIAAGRPDVAAEHAAEAVDILAGQVSPDDPELATYRGALATALVTAGRTEEGLSHFERALHSLERANGPGDPRVVNAHYQVAWAAGIAALDRDESDPQRRRQLEQAGAELRAALPYVDQVPAELHGRIRLELGELALLRGDLEEARSQCRQSASLWTKPNGRGAQACIEEATPGSARPQPATPPT